MDLGIAGKTAFVTGAAKGIGAAVAKTLCAEGCTVAISDIDAPALEEQAEALSTASARVWPYSLDVTDRDGVKRVFRDAVSKHGPIDILINNAGIVRPDATETITDEQFDIVYDVNFRGALYCCQEVVQSMQDRKWGRIVNMCSLVVKLIGRVDVLSYAASKAAMAALTKMLAKQLGPEGITVNAVLPGSIALTDFNDAIGYPKTTDLMPGMNIPVGRRGTPEDVAPAVAFLTSQGAEYITGEFIDVNGGLYMD